ncbi:MAG: hypothetical protein GZ093_10855 [Rhodoferax sp.]|uniref:hypothetical protein n=1 Tax=Rhodoferax sp. TaxID=50421 RepID=UPI00140022D4|nr:hypothetical protein [Rhodoferax sp.]NDP39231.1 hypothetical protein [Rhodoferax sp.]
MTLLRVNEMPGQKKDPSDRLSVEEARAVDIANNQAQQIALTPASAVTNIKPLKRGVAYAGNWSIAVPGT